MKSINHWTATQLGQHGVVIAAVLIVVFAAQAVAVFFPPAVTRAVLIIGIVVLLAVWITAQDLGTIATGHATDPNSALPLVLLLACYWPTTRIVRNNGAPRTSSAHTASTTR